jgi:hypothetical protein
MPWTSRTSVGDDDRFGLPSSSVAAVAPAGCPQTPWHALVAGAVGGRVVWGRQYHSAINYQILLYLSGRVFVGLWKRWLMEGMESVNGSGTGPNPFMERTVASASVWQRIRDQLASISTSTHVYPIMSSIIWGIVMMLFEETPQVLHPSLKSSMDEIYRCVLRWKPSSNQITAPTCDDTGSLPNGAV